MIPSAQSKVKVRGRVSKYKKGHGSDLFSPSKKIP
jgi:hypothetical protein